jgi:2-polyprenyl-3-methyl-5-hydroxy-6-metoxy-1,4-benzoquinol methylase
MKKSGNPISQKLYDRYTTTSHMAGVDEKFLSDWSGVYFRAHFAALLPLNRDAKILEVGCGYGRYLKELLDMGYTNAYGIDISEEQIQYARRELGLSIAEKADAVDWLRNKNDQFDCILVLDVLEHLQTDYLLTLGESIYSSLKPGGRVLVQVPNGVLPLNDHRYGDLTHMRAFTTKSMRQFFLLSGLKPIGYYDIPPIMNGIVGFIRRVLWSFVLKPIIACYMMVANGSRMGGIYTPNFLAVAQKD